MSRAYYVNSLSGRVIEHLTNQCYSFRNVQLMMHMSKSEMKKNDDKRRMNVCNIILLIVSRENEEKLMVRIMFLAVTVLALYS